MSIVHTEYLSLLSSGVEEKSNKRVRIKDDNKVFKKTKLDLEFESYRRAELFLRVWARKCEARRITSLDSPEALAIHDFMKLKAKQYR